MTRPIIDISPASQWIDEPTAAKRIGMTASALRAWRAAGTAPPHSKFGRSVRYNVSELDTWATSRTVRS